MRQYDFALAWNDTLKEKFIYWIKRECKIRNLKYLIITDSSVRNVIKDLEKGVLNIKFLLDCAAEYYDKDDPFARLCYAVKDVGGYVLCDPDDAKQAANKAVTHYDLLKAKIPVPYTVVVRNWEPNNFKLSKHELELLGSPFIIKPALGFAQKGVVKDAKGSITEIAKARHFSRGDNFLLQEKVKTISLDGKEAWFRVYFLFGEIMPCWWDTNTGWYAHVSLRQVYNYRLLSLARIISEIASVTNMEFFSSEIAITGEKKNRRFVAIDYVNDQPELRVRSGKLNGDFIPGPVPEVIEHVAERVVNIAWKMSKNIPLGIHRSIWLAKAKITDESI